MIYIKKYVFLICLCLSVAIIPMDDPLEGLNFEERSHSNEEISQQNSSMPVISEEQAQALSLALQQIYQKQMAVSSSYTAILQAIKDSFSDDQVKEQAQVAIGALKNLAVTVVNKVNLDVDQANNLYNILATIKEMINFKMQYEAQESLDEKAEAQALELKERFLAFLMPLMAAKEQVFGEQLDLIAEGCVSDALLDIIDKAMKILQPLVTTSGLKKAADLPIAEPFIPKMMPLDQDDAGDEDGLVGE